MSRTFYCALLILAVLTTASRHAHAQAAKKPTPAKPAAPANGTTDDALLPLLDAKRILYEFTEDGKHVRTVTFVFPKLNPRKGETVVGRPVDEALYELIAKLPQLEQVALGITDATEQQLDGLSKLTKVKKLFLFDATGSAGSYQYKGPLTADLLQKIGEALPNLESLHTNNYVVTDESLAGLAAFPNLRSLSVGVGITDAGLEHLRHLPNLEELDLSGAKITDVGLEHIKPCTKLSSLRILNHVKGPGLVHLAGLTSLRTLDLGKTPVSNESIQLLAPLKDLEELDLGFAVTGDCLVHLLPFTKIRKVTVPRKTTDANLAALEKMVGLEELYVWWHEITPAAMSSIAKMTSLKSLTLPRSIGAKDLIHLKSLKKLESLDLRRLKVDDPAMPALGQFTTLKKLRTPLQMTDAGMPSVGKLVNLVELDVSGSYVTGSGLAHLKNVKPLESLNVIGTRVKDEHLPALYPLQKLHTFLAFGTRVSPKGIDALHSKIPTLDYWPAMLSVLGAHPKFDRYKQIVELQLRSGQFQNHERFTTDRLTYAAKIPTLQVMPIGPLSDANYEQLGKITSLQRLDVRRITDQQAAHLKNLKNLRFLRIDGGDITDEGVKIIEGFPELRELHILHTPNVTANIFKMIDNCAQLERLNLGFTGLRAEKEFLKKFRETHQP